MKDSIFSHIGYYLLLSCSWLVSLLPLRVLYVLSDVSYFIVRYVVRYRRQVVRRNLAEAFPEKSEEERLDIERRFYHLLCDYFVENIKVTSMSRREMLRRMVFKNTEWVEKQYAEGRQFGFCMVGHYGNWEWMASMQYWLPTPRVCQIYHRLRNHVVDRYFMRNRGRYGGESIKMSKTLRRLVEIYRSGDKIMVGAIADQQPKWNAIHHFTPFLHHDTAVFTGTEVMAKKFNSFLCYGRISRPRRGYYEFEFLPITDSPSDFPDFELTDRYMQLLEQDIRREPYLWLWTHKRWTRTREEWERRQSAGPHSSVSYIAE